MLKQQIQRHRLPRLDVFDTVKQVGLALAQVVIEEGAVDEGQRCPVEAVSEGVGQAGPKQVGGFAGIGKEGPEEVLVGLVNFVGHGRGFFCGLMDTRGDYRG